MASLRNRVGQTREPSAVRIATHFIHEPNNIALHYPGYPQMIQGLNQTQELRFVFLSAPPPVCALQLWRGFVIRQKHKSIHLADRFQAASETIAVVPSAGPHTRRQLPGFIGDRYDICRTVSFFEVLPHGLGQIAGAGWSHNNQAIRRPRRGSGKWAMFPGWKIEELIVLRHSFLRQLSDARILRLPFTDRQPIPFPRKGIGRQGQPFRSSP